MSSRAHPDNAHLAVSNRPETILGITITFLIVAILAVALRMFVRFRERLFGCDDACVLLAAVAMAAGSVLACLMAVSDGGLGLHFWTLDHETRMVYFKDVWATNVTYTIGTTLIKLAILLQYLRLFADAHHSARKLTWAMLGITTAWGFSFTVLAVFSCRPIAKNWNYLLPGTCVAWGSKNPDKFFATWAGHAASNMFLDIVILMLPVPYFGQLSALNNKTRRGLLTLFGMGAVVVMISTARVISLTMNRAGTVPIFDPSYHTPSIYIFSVVEIDMAILCASTPIFWPLVSSLGLDKILIVKEVTVRTERRSEHIDLVEAGKRAECSEVEVGDGRASSTSEEADRSRCTPSRITCALARHHRHHASASSDSVRIGARPSQDSQRELRPSQPPSSNASFPYLARPSRGLAPSDGTVARYADRYMQELAAPDFDSMATPPLSRG